MAIMLRNIVLSFLKIFVKMDSILAGQIISFGVICLINLILLLKIGFFILSVPLYVRWNRVLTFLRNSLNLLLICCDMCTSPITILNRSKYWDIHKPLFFHVPCGKCEDCKKKNREEWFVRCYFEWLKHHNSTYFYTLTFRESDLPRCFDVPCFDKRELQRFLKRFRKVLSKFGITLKYLITCEYGELRKRPHMHCLFYLSKPLKWFVLENIIHDTWKHGIVKPGDNGGLVNSSNGIRYVVKYITKDDSYMSVHERRLRRCLFFKYARTWLLRWKDAFTCPLLSVFDKNVLQKLLDFGKPLSHDLFQSSMVSSDKISAFADYTRDVILQYCSELSCILPFHLQSTKLGISALDDLTVHQEINETCFVLGDGDKPLPRYFKRKLWMDATPNYDYTVNSRFVFNERGRQHLLDSFEHKYQKELTKLEGLLKQPVSEGLFLFINQWLHTKFDKQEDLAYYLDNVKNHVYVPLLAVYRSIFRSRYCPYSSFFNAPAEYFVEKRRKYYIRSIYAFSYIDCGDVCNMSESERLKAVSNKFGDCTLWNNTELFLGYEFLSEVLDAISVFQRQLVDNKDVLDDKDVRWLRQRYKDK